MTSGVKAKIITGLTHWNVVTGMVNCQVPSAIVRSVKSCVQNSSVLPDCSYVAQKSMHGRNREISVATADQSRRVNFSLTAPGTAAARFEGWSFGNVRS